MLSKFQPIRGARSLSAILAPLTGVLLAACSATSAEPQTAMTAPQPALPVVIETIEPEPEVTFEQVGTASWYGPGFNGRPTASGEIFDETQLTAAHRDLDLPSVVEVTNLANGRSVVVRVNDRGPYAGDRVIDLSRAAAETLGFIDAGLAEVRVRAYADPETEILDPMVAVARQPQIFLQAGAFPARTEAEALKLETGMEAARIETVRLEGQRYHRVRLGPFDTVADAQAFADSLESRLDRPLAVMVD